jgi:hypothetical protein
MRYMGQSSRLIGLRLFLAFHLWFRQWMITTRVFKIWISLSSVSYVACVASAGPSPFPFDASTVVAEVDQAALVTAR